MPHATEPDRAQRLATFESNYGRDWGWFVEKDGVVVAELVDPQWEDTFWCGYRVQALEGASLPDEVFTTAFWHGTGLVFLNRVTAEVVRAAFAGGEIPTRDRPRVSMRGLYSGLRPTHIERAILWFRRRRRARQPKPTAS